MLFCGVMLHRFSENILRLPAKPTLLPCPSIPYNTSMKSSVQKREKTVKQAIANEKLEGLQVSRETRKIADTYIVGKAAADKIRARYRNL